MEHRKELGVTVERIRNNVMKPPRPDSHEFRKQLNWMLLSKSRVEFRLRLIHGYIIKQAPAYENTYRQMNRPSFVKIVKGR